MITTMKMMGLNSQRRNSQQQQQQQPGQGKREQEQREDYTSLPRLIQSPAGSITSTCSSGPDDGDNFKAKSPYSSSSRMQKKFGLTARKRLPLPVTARDSIAHQRAQQCQQVIQENYDHRQHYRRYSRRDDNFSNDSILMGAHIIKRQLSGTNAATYTNRDIDSPNTHNNYNTYDYNDGDDEWSPWKTENDARENRSNHSDSNIIEDGDDEDDDTLNLLEKAKSIISSRSDLTDKNRRRNDHECNKENMKSCMVQRVSDMDNSTFYSSSSDGGGNHGYLPNYLNSDFACCESRNPFKNNPDSESQLLQSSKKESSEEKDVETSMHAVDFLAILHAEEEELNITFDSVEEEQGLYAPGKYGTELTSLPPSLSPSAASTENNCISCSGDNTERVACRGSSRSSQKEVSSNSPLPLERIKAPCVTAAAIPFQRMVAPRSSYYDELLIDPSYLHALKAGTLWQSLCSQHVRFPSQWWDGEEPASPPLGSTKKKSWDYLGRHRVQGDYKLNSLIGNRGSSGRILLHLVVRDNITLEPIEDICCGCFHPNARGVRTTPEYNPQSEDCRDVWIAHRRRAQERRVFVQEEDSTYASDSDSDDMYSWTTIEALLRHQNKNRVDCSPLGAQGGKSCVNNENLRAVFGSKPPVYTVFPLESELYEIFQNKLDGSIPASVVLLRHYLRYRIG